MTTIERCRAIWTGFSGAPGVTTWYTDDAINMLPVMRTFFNANAGNLPNAVTVSFEPFGSRIDDATGALVGNWTTTPTPAVVAGGGGTLYQAPVGLVVNWLTSTVVGSRFLRGKTFLVPGIGGTGVTDGTPAAGNLTNLQAAAAAVIAATPNLLIWHRPVNNVGGSSATVTAASVPDKYVVLRSRRD